MKYRLFINLTIIICCCDFCVYPQTDSSQVIHNRWGLKKEVIPISFIATGTALNFSNFKYYVRSKLGNTTNTSLENYIQYAPIVELYTGDLAGIKHNNTVWDQTKYLAISEIVISALVQSLKRITNIPRPNGASMSFPSGHTSNSFASATALFEEFKDDNLPLGLSGYGFSTATGMLRMTNNKHWISDVLTGAGLGILVTHLVYIWKPLRNWQPFRTKKNAQIIPGFSFSTDSASLVIQLQPK
jgi:hypothetical protein